MPINVMEGMLVEGGRIIAIGDESVTVWDAAAGQPREVELGEVEFEVSDRVTFLLLLDQLATRVGLEPSQGLLWYIGPTADSDEPAWVLEDTEQVRTRDGDTENAAEALVRALVETEVAEE